MVRHVLVQNTYGILKTMPCFATMKVKLKNDITFVQGCLDQKESMKFYTLFIAKTSALFVG